MGQQDGVTVKIQFRTNSPPRLICEFSNKLTWEANEGTMPCINYCYCLPKLKITIFGLKGSVVDFLLVQVDIYFVQDLLVVVINELR